MELVILGSGASAPARTGPVRNPAGSAVRVDSGILIFDLGFGNVRQLARAEMDFADVTDVFLTHRHPDHVGDLAALMFLLRYERQPRAKKLRVWGPKGIVEFWGRLEKAYEPWLTPRGYKFEIAEVTSGGKISGEGWTVAAAKVPHPTPALAFRLEERGKSFVYSGDTGPSDSLAKFARDADLFLLECTVPSPNHTTGHLSPTDALALIEASSCRKAMLTHLSTESAAEAAVLIQTRAHISLAEDLSRQTI